MRRDADPGPEHAMLMKGVGTWNVKAKFFMGPDAPPMESTATDTVRAVGGFWTVGDYRSEFMGMPFHGVSMVGYDPHAGEFLSTWADSMMPNFFYLRGNIDGDTMVLKGEAYNPQAGGKAMYTIKDRFVSDDEHHMSMYMDCGGHEMQLFEMVYTRA
ncbi:MAG: DUF1579 domain-containing protein [Planctomycetota bacterium]